MQDASRFQERRLHRIMLGIDRCRVSGRDPHPSHTVRALVADFGAVWKQTGTMRDAETNPPGFTPIAGINPHD